MHLESCQSLTLPRYALFISALNCCLIDILPCLKNDDLFLIGRLSIPTAEGIIYCEATGTNSLKDTAYGDASSNAESMAFRRAAAKFGLALYLYDK